MVVVRLIVEGYRWQMIPAYLSPFILTSRYLFAESKRTLKVVGIHSQDSATGHLFDYCGHASFLMPVVLFENERPLQGWYYTLSLD